jgi:hypothetical protein
VKKRTPVGTPHLEGNEKDARASTRSNPAEGVNFTQKEGKKRSGGQEKGLECSLSLQPLGGTDGNPPVVFLRRKIGAGEKTLFPLSPGVGPATVALHFHGRRFRLVLAGYREPMRLSVGAGQQKL